MKFLVSIILIVVSVTVEALSCAEYMPPNGESIQIKIDTTKVSYFTLPATLDGHSLQTVTLWAYPINASAGELVAPLAFKIKSGNATGKFAITAPFVKAEIIASYSKDLCGPRLESIVSI